MREVRSKRNVGGTVEVEGRTFTVRGAKLYETYQDGVLVRLDVEESKLRWKRTSGLGEVLLAPEGATSWTTAVGRVTVDGDTVQVEVDATCGYGTQG